MVDDVVLNFLRHLAKGLADQFGPNCEIHVIHDLSDNYKENSIVAIENGPSRHQPQSRRWPVYGRPRRPCAAIPTSSRTIRVT